MKFKFWLALVAALVLAPGLGHAQSAVKTYPLQVNTANASGTVASTNVFQSIWAAVPIVNGQQGRTSCTVQNNGTHTMYVFFGAIANATEGASVTLTTGQSVNCSVNNVTLQDQVSITGTSGEAFYAAQQ